MSIDTVDAASSYARRLVERESKGHGDVDGALHRLEAKFGIGKWQIAHLRSGKAKSCDMGLFLRLRAAYLAMCERQLATLEHEIAIERATRGVADDDIATLEAEASALARRIEAKKAALRGK